MKAKRTTNNSSSFDESAYTFLNTLAEKYGTDKLQHGYIDQYAKHLPRNLHKMMEIGVATGASAKMWLDYYQHILPEIYIFDLFQNTDFVGEHWCLKQGLFPVKGDQGSIIDLSVNRIPKDLSVIIDDGSHNAHHQLTSFKALFLNNLRSGGLYFIEDTHCNKDLFYYGGLVKQFHDTPLSMFKEFLDENDVAKYTNTKGKINNPYFNEGEKAVYESLIASVEIQCEEKLIIIKRK